MRKRLIFVMVFALPIVATAQTPDFAAAKAEATKMLQDLVRIDTSNPPGNEIKAAEYVKGVLKKEGVESVIVESAPGRASLIARLKGNGSKKPDRKSTRLNSSHIQKSRMPSSA